MSVTHRTRLRGLAAGLVVAAAVGLFAAPAGALTDPEEWGDTFCTETAEWLTGAQQGADELSTQADDPSLTPADAKSLIVDFLATGVDATSAFLKEMKRAGVPDVTNGPKIEAAILAGIAGSGAKLAALEKTAKAMPTKPLKAFQKASTKLGNEVGTFSEPFTKGVSKAESLDTSGALGNVLGTLPACAELDRLASGG
jgi:hypothetical protein